MGEKIQSELYFIDPKNKSDVESVAKLHQMLLNWGPIANLGVMFLKNFVYSHLVADGLLKAVLCKINGKPAGFIAFTAYSKIFVTSVIKEHRFRITILLLKSLLMNPMLFPKLYKAIRMMHTLLPSQCQDDCPSAEIMAIGVLPEYRNSQFIYKTGLRTSHDLFMMGVEYFKNRGLDQMHLFVDKFNKSAIFFYKFIGGKEEWCERAGKTLVRFLFDLSEIIV